MQQPQPEGRMKALSVLFVAVMMAVVVVASIVGCLFEMGWRLSRLVADLAEQTLLDESVP